MNNKNFLITILMAALSLIVIFAVSCGDKPTGSTPGAGDALVSSVPSPKGEPVSEGDALFNKDGKEYPLTLTFSESESGYKGSFTNDDYLKKQSTNTNFTLGITNGVVTFNRKYDTGQEAIFSNAQLLYDSSSGKYNAGVSKEYNNEGYTSSSKEYIEFKSADGNTLTYFKFEAAYSVKGGTNDYGMKLVYEQQ